MVVMRMIGMLTTKVLGTVFASQLRRPCGHALHAIPNPYIPLHCTLRWTPRHQSEELLANARICSRTPEHLYLRVLEDAVLEDAVLEDADPGA